MRRVGHSAGSWKYYQGWASRVSGSYCRVWVPASGSLQRSKTPEEIRRLTLIRSLWSSEAKGTLNYKQPHSKGKFVKHLLPGTPHSAPGQPGFSRPINWHCWCDLPRLFQQEITTKLRALVALKGDLRDLKHAAKFGSKSSHFLPLKKAISL